MKEYEISNKDHVRGEAVRQISIERWKKAVDMMSAITTDESVDRETRYKKVMELCGIYESPNPVGGHERPTSSRKKPINNPNFGKTYPIDRAHFHHQRENTRL